MTNDPNTPDTGDSPESAQDPIRQIKGEMNRKLDKQNEQIQALLKQQGDLLSAIQAAQAAPTRQAAPEPEEDIESLMLTEPKKAAARIRQEAVREATQTINGQLAHQQAINNTIASLAADYPELADSNSELVKTTMQILGTIPESERKAHTYEYAVNKAANQLDMRPRAKRQETEDFSAPSYSAAATRKRARSDGQIVESSKEQAKILGLDLSNEKAKAAFLKIMKERGLK